MYVMLLLYVELPLAEFELYDENDEFWATETDEPFLIVSPLSPLPAEQPARTRALAAATATNAPRRDFFNGPPVQGVNAPTTNRRSPWRG